MGTSLFTKLAPESFGLLNCKRQWHTVLNESSEILRAIRKSLYISSTLKSALADVYHGATQSRYIEKLLDSTDLKGLTTQTSMEYAFGHHPPPRNCCIVINVIPIIYISDCVHMPVCIVLPSLTISWGFTGSSLLVGRRVLSRDSGPDGTTKTPIPPQRPPASFQPKSKE